MEKLKKFLLYAGFDQPSLKRVASGINESNRLMSKALSAVAAVLISVMLFTTLHSETLRQNRLVYTFGLVLSIIVFLLSLLAKKYSCLIDPLVNAAYLIYYLYGIFIGAVTEPAGKTVTFMVMLVFMPTLFVSRPMRIVLTTVFYDTIFIVLCLMNKVEPVLSIDIIDAVLFGILGVASGSLINLTKFNWYVSEQKLREISRIDQLTQMNNRNAFEMDLFAVSAKCRQMLACIYIDVNGLHELNNSKGHEHGDIMLKFVAEQLRNIFSAELSYRVGGDEFVVFVPDTSHSELKRMVQELTEKVEANGYHIATGYDIAPLRQLSIDDLIKTAEVQMFRNKDQYYKNILGRKVRNEIN